MGASGCTFARGLSTALLLALLGSVVGVGGRRERLAVGGGSTRVFYDQIYYRGIPESVLNDSRVITAKKALYDAIFVERRRDLRSFFGEVWMNTGAFEFYWNMGLRVPDDGKVVELGSFFGASTVIWASAMKARGNRGGKVYSVDPFSPSYRKTFERNVVAWGLGEYIEMRPGKSTDRYRDFENGFFDIIYVDAGHTFKEALGDIDLWFPKLKKGGLMSGHDATFKWKGVIKAGYAFAAKYTEADLEYCCCETNSAGIWHYRWRKGLSGGANVGGWKDSS